MWVINISRECFQLEMRNKKGKKAVDVGKVEMRNKKGKKAVDVGKVHFTVSWPLIYWM